MASPVPIAPVGGWNHNGQAMPPNNNEFEDSGVQLRPMGLKVHYTFDKDSKVNCLARYPHTLQVQTIPLDDKNSIGVIDLRVCLQAVTECSPELAAQDGDYTVYALDYSEPDTPLVGQGMLSWALESMRGDWNMHQPKMVTGRVTRNVLAVFGGGNRETLEVKLKLTAAAKVQRPECQPSMEMQPMRPMDTVMTPTGTAEWNSFMQSNPQLGHSAHVSRVASPALSQGPPAGMIRRDSFGPPAQSMPIQEIQRVAPVPVDPATMPAQPSSRPSSRSSRRKQPTGRPRGRPRKKPVEGNTSGYEDGTEGEEGPAKKRAKTTKVEKATPNPFGAGPESLRVAASTSGSIRNFRPIAANTDNAAGNHLQEVPRAPTPVPEGGPMNMPPRGGPNGKPRRESSMRQEFTSNLANQHPQQPKRALSPSQEDGRSPESLAPTPNYSEDSPQDIGSSPPVARTAPFLRSSPPPSSPILPPMPQAADTGFMNGELDDLFDEALLQPLRESQLATHAPVQKVIEVKDSTGIPTRVFQMKPGPDGHGLVHIQNYNTPHPTSTPAGPPSIEAPSLPPLKKNPIRSRPVNPTAKRSRPSPPALAPTPPPTTDAIEKNASPVPVSEAAAAATVEPMEIDDVTTETSTETSTSTEPVLALEAAFTPDIPPPQVPLPNPLNSNTNPPRHLSRSQSAGPLAFPTVPASEPAGPSTLSQSILPDPPRATTEIPAVLRRSNSTGPLTLPVPASDPVGPPEPVLNLASVAFSEAPCPPSDALPTPSSPPTKSNKNQVKKQSIKQRLEKAIANGEMPPFCTNCGAIETPTWRKIWVQDHDGVPEYVEYSEKPGRITAIDVLKRDDENKPLSYRLIKKSLGGDDDRSAWLEQLLCNPCGIWVTKYRTHRPQDKWDNSFGRLGQDRRKRGPGQNNSRSKKARTKSDSQPNLASEPYFATDPLGPIEPSSPKHTEGAPSQGDTGPGLEQTRDSEAPSMLGNDLPNNDMSRSNPGSTHSRGSGTALSPIDIDLDGQLGSTRRLLFPSPRKDNSPRVLGELNVNIVQTTECRQNKEVADEKENMAVNEHEEASQEHDILESLFRSPAHARPSTPPPTAKATASSTPFKTPTRPTPSHRPVTRSVSRSLRSVRDVLMSPSGQALLQRTPTRTPRGSLNVQGSASRRRSPRNQQVNFDSVFDTPLSRTISQMLSDPAFDLGNGDLDLSSLPALDTSHGNLIDFGNLLSTDAVMPSSPPKDGSLGFDYSGSAEVWAQWSIEQRVRVDEMEE